MKNTLTSLTLTGLTIGAFIAGYYLTKPPSCGAACEKRIGTVSPQEFKEQALEKSAKIIDVRRSDEYASGHIEGSINADVSNLPKFNQFLETLDKDGKYLVYCRSGSRSSQAMKLMEEKGFTSITNLSGGILAWQNENLLLVR